MAFAGMFLGVVFIIIIAAVFLAAIIMRIIGIVLACKKKKVPATILIVISAIPTVVAIIVMCVFRYSATHAKCETYDGRQVTVNMRDVTAMKKYIEDNDMEGLDTFLSKHPELIYYQDNNHQTLLEYGLRDHNVKIMEIAVNHGMKFDAEPTFRNLRQNCSLEKFFDDEYMYFIPAKRNEAPKTKTGETTDDVIKAAKFAVEHGAATSWKKNTGTYTFANIVEQWVWEDRFLSDKDKELLEYAKSVS